MASTHRLAALVLSLGLLGGIGATAPEDLSTSLEVQTPFVHEHNRHGVSYTPLDREEEKRLQNISWMRSEISNLWELYLDEQGFVLNELKIGQLEVLSQQLAEAIEKYQKTPSNYAWWNPKRVGSTLPKESDVHLLLATMAVIESKVDPKVVGKLGEVGILQCHRWCRKGHPQKEVRNNPELAIDLSVQFLAEMVDRCGISMDTIRSKELKDKAWTKPVSVYGAGNSAIVNSRCMEKRFARWRISEMKRLREEIRKQQGENNGGERVCEGTSTAQTAGSFSSDPV